jgi:hypothetical protein
MVPVPGQHPIAPCHAILQTSEKAGRARARRAAIALSLIKPFKRLLFGFVVAYRTITLPDRPQQRRGSQRRRPADLHPGPTATHRGARAKTDTRNNSARSHPGSSLNTRNVCYTNRLIIR